MGNNKQTRDAHMPYAGIYPQISLLNPAKIQYNSMKQKFSTHKLQLAHMHVKTNSQSNIQCKPYASSYLFIMHITQLASINRTTSSIVFPPTSYKTIYQLASIIPHYRSNLVIYKSYGKNNYRS